MPNWKKVIISGSDAALNSLEITSHLTASGLIYPTVDGTDGQALMTDGSGNLTFDDLITYVTVKNVAAGTLEKGTPVHSTGTIGNSPEVIASSASLANTMPAGFVLAQDIAAGSEGRAILAGFLTGVDTNGLDEGANVYVGTNGGYTTTKPTGAANQIQNIAIVGNSATNGSIYIVGAGRSNDVPNLPTGKIWVGDGYTVTSSVVHLDESNERLGINTNTPNQALDVLGSANISGSLIIDNPSYSGTHTIAQIANNQFRFTNSGIGAYMTVGSGNAVEINSQRLKSLGRGLELDATISSTPLQVGTAGVGTGKGLTVLNSASNYNVGIGSNAPTAKLNIVGNGTTSATTALLIEDSSGTDLLEVNDQGNVTIPNGSLSLNGATDTETFNLAGNIFFDGNGTVSAGGVGNNLTLQAQSANIAIGYPGAADITITGGVSGSFSGSFEGDGTNLTGITAEWDGTHNGDAEITGSLTISGSSADLTVTGNVGIGTTSPGTKLEVFDPVVNGAQATFRYGVDYSLSVGYNRVLSNLSGTTDFRVGTSTANHMSLLTDNIQRLTIEHTTGDVGIGITSPTARLNIQGSGATSATDALLVENSSGTDLLKVRDDGFILGNSTVKFGHSLEIERSGPSINFKTTNNAVASGLVFQNSGGSTTARIYHTPDTGKIDFWPSNGGSKMNLTTDGLELTGSLVVSGSGVDLTVEGNISGSGNLNIDGNFTMAGGTLDTAGGIIDTNGGNIDTNGGDITLGTGALNGNVPGSAVNVDVVTATIKNFVIDHPSEEKADYKLRHSSLEGPEVGVYFRGKSTGSIIHIPDYWKDLVDEDSITVNLTSFGSPCQHYIEDIKDNQVIVGCACGTPNYHFTVYGERKDVEKLVVEYKEETYL